MLVSKNHYKPFYKQFLKFRENVQDRKKLLKFKKQKWVKFNQYHRRQLKRYRKFKLRNLNQYLVSKYPNKYNSYKNRFKARLLKTQQINIFYGGLSKKYFKKQLKSILKTKQKLNLLFLELLEKRLDVILYRSKFSYSIKNARQLITHGKVLVNNKIVKSKSYLIKHGDLISVNLKYAILIKNNLIKSSIWPIPPKHLIINYKTMQISVGNFKQTNFSSNFTLDMGKLISAKYY